MLSFVQSLVEGMNLADSSSPPTTPPLPKDTPLTTLPVPKVSPEERPTGLFTFFKPLPLEPQGPETLFPKEKNAVKNETRNPPKPKVVVFKNHFNDWKLFLKHVLGGHLRAPDQILQHVPSDVGLFRAEDSLLKVNTDLLERIVDSFSQVLPFSPEGDYSFEKETTLVVIYYDRDKKSDALQNYQVAPLALEDKRNHRTFAWFSNCVFTVDDNETKRYKSTKNKVEAGDRETILKTSPTDLVSYLFLDFYKLSE